jgi:hypothetical protein
MAVHRGLEFGTEVIFTYGPLGFLRIPTLWYGDLAVLAFLYSAAIYVALSCSLVWALRRSLGAASATFVAFFTLALLPPIEQPLVIAVVWCLGVLSRERPRYAVEGLAVGGASLAAVETLIRLSPGPVILVVCLIALIGARARWWQVSALVALFAVELLLLWVLSGQSLADLTDYIGNAKQIVSGYSEAMAVKYAPSWEAPAAVVVLVGVVCGAAAASYRDPLARWCAAALIALAGFAVFKQGIVRFEINHVGYLFSTACAMWLAIPWSQRQRQVLISGAVVLAAVAVHVLPVNGAANLDVIGNVRLAGSQARTLFSPARQAEITEQGREGMKGVYRLDSRTLAELRGHPVDLDPWEIGVAWAYDLDWSPLPVFQNYSAYTETLDRLNAAEIESSPGRERILRENPPLVDGEYPTRTIDGRYPGWDPPAQARAILCRFAPLRTTSRWQVLRRTADRCGSPTLIRSVESSFGEQVAVPAPAKNEVVFARIHGAEVDGLERLRTLFFRSKLRFAVLNGTSVYRLVPGTAADGLLLRGGAGLAGGGPFSQIPQARTIELTGVSGELRFDFFRMTVRPAPGETTSQKTGAT